MNLAVAGNVPSFLQTLQWLATFHAVTANYLEEFPGGEEAAKKKMDILFIK